jgi:hypothetical protein
MGQLAEIFSGVVIRPGTPEKFVQNKTSNPANPDFGDPGIPVRSQIASFIGISPESAKDFIISYPYPIDIANSIPGSPPKSGSCDPDMQTADHTRAIRAWRPPPWRFIRTTPEKQT